MEENEKLRIKAALGDFADSFFMSDLGQAVIERSFVEIAEQQERFEAAKNGDTELMQDVHFRIKVARKGLEWLNEILNEGRQSIDLLEDGQ